MKKRILVSLSLLSTLMLSGCPMQRAYNIGYDEDSGKWSGGVVITPIHRQK